MASVAIYTNKTTSSPRRANNKNENSSFVTRNRTLLNNDSSIMAMNDVKNNSNYSTNQVPATLA